MKLTYKNKKRIAIIVFVSVVFTFLLALNFKAWDASYIEGSFDEIIITQSQELEHCVLLNNGSRESINSSIQINQLLDTGFAGIIPCCLLLSLLPFLHFISTYRSKLFFDRKHTLVSLCVRIDD